MWRCYLSSIKRRWLLSKLYPIYFTKMLMLHLIPKSETNPSIDLYFPKAHNSRSFSFLRWPQVWIHCRYNIFLSFLFSFQEPRQKDITFSFFFFDIIRNNFTRYFQLFVLFLRHFLSLFFFLSMWKLAPILSAFNRLAYWNGIQWKEYLWYRSSMRKGSTLFARWESKLFYNTEYLM